MVMIGSQRDVYVSSKEKVNFMAGIAKGFKEGSTLALTGRACAEGRIGNFLGITGRVKVRSNLSQKRGKRDIGRKAI